MTVSHTLATRQGITNLVVDQLDGGVLRYLTAADATVADGAYGTPAFGAADGSATATANAIGNAQNTTGGTLVVAKFACRSTTLDIVFGAVTLTGGGGDMEMTNTSVADQEEIITDSQTYTSTP